MRKRLRRLWRRLIPSRRVATLEIDSSSLRLLETHGQVVAKWAVYPLAPGLFENEVVNNPRALGIAIRQLLKSNGIKTKNIFASLNGLYSLSRIISVPASPSKEPVTNETVAEKVKDVLPLSEEEIYLSWQPIARMAEETRVLVVGTPRNLVDGEVKSIRAGGIRIRALELKSMALVRAVDRKQALILNIEPTTFDTVLIAEGIAQSMRTVAWQPNGQSTGEMAEYISVILELTVGAFNSSRPGFLFDPATPLFITGSMSGNPELLAAIRSRVAYPAGEIESPLECPPHFPASQYAVNIGLALRKVNKNAGSGQNPLTMNLLPQIYRPWKPTPRQAYVFLAIAAIVALLIPAYNLISNVHTKTIYLRATFNQGKAQMERRQAELAKRDPLQKFLVTYQSMVDMGGGFMDGLKVIIDNAAKFGVEVPAFTYAGGTYTISVAADNSSAFRDYIEALQGNGLFSSVEVPDKQYPDIKEGQIRLVAKK